MTTTGTGSTSDNDHHCLDILPAAERIGEQLASTLHGVLAHPQPGDPGGAFETTMAELVDAVGDHPDRARLLVAGATVLHRAVRAGAPPESRAWTSDVDERRRLAREVHDWVGSGVALALHQLDLFSVEDGRGEPSAAKVRVSTARRTLQELQVASRRLVSELRDRALVTDLEVEIREFVAQANVLGSRTTIAVRGDERHLSPQVRDEIFAVVREGLRNAFTHACAEHVTVVVDIGPDAVRASVDDDGVGIGWRPDHDCPDHGASRGSGLVVMRERITSLGGTFAVTATQPRGTRLDLCVGLPARPRRPREEQPDVG